MYGHKTGRTVIIFQVLSILLSAVIIFAIIRYTNLVDYWIGVPIAILLPSGLIIIFTWLVIQLTNDKWQIGENMLRYVRTRSWKEVAFWALIGGLFGGVAGFLGSRF